MFKRTEERRGGVGRGVALMWAKAVRRSLIHGLCNYRESLVRCILRIEFSFLLFQKIEVCKEYAVSRLCQGIELPAEWFGRQSDYLIGECVGGQSEGCFLIWETVLLPEAVSDLAGKASIHPEEVSTRASMSFTFCVGGMWVKSIFQSSPGIYDLESDVLGMKE